MKNYIIAIVTILFMSLSMQAQKNEYRYLAIRLGFSNAFSGQPELNTQKYIYAEALEGASIPQMSVQPVKSFTGYVPGVKASILYHFDFTGDFAGIFTGLDYNFTGVSSKYETLTRGFNIVETHRMHMVGIPLAVKYGPDIWDTQRYVYIGGQINYIASMYTNEKASWGENKGRKLEDTEYNKTTFSLFAGFNWKIINVQFDFYPKSIFNENYELKTTYKFPNPKKGDENKTLTLYPNKGQVSSFFKLTVSVNVPYGWLSEKSFKIRRMLLKVPWK